MNHYKEIESLIENYEVNKRVREYKDNSEKLITNWNIGKEIVAAQGGEKRAKYGDRLIKEWGAKLSQKFGNNYNERNLKYYRNFYLKYQNVNAVRSQLHWTHYRLLLSIKNENERNYYINQVILNNLSTRELNLLIKSKSFDRLSYADKNNIKVIDNNSSILTIEDMIKDPIILTVNNKIDNIDEKVIHKLLIDKLENKFLELGTGFALIGHEYKIIMNNRTYKIDLLFFNYKLNCFVVVEIKSRELKKEDISQLQFYVNYIDRNIKEANNNKTIGILIVKKNNRYVIEYTTSNDIYVTTYKLDIGDKIRQDN